MQSKHQKLNECRVVGRFRIGINDAVRQTVDFHEKKKPTAFCVGRKINEQWTSSEWRWSMMIDGLFVGSFWCWVSLMIDYFRSNYESNATCCVNTIGWLEWKALSDAEEGLIEGLFCCSSGVSFEKALEKESAVSQSNRGHFALNSKSISLSISLINLINSIIAC